MTRVYYKEAVGALVVFDVTRVSTFEAVTKWKNDIDTKVVLPDGKPIPVVLLANKVRWFGFKCFFVFLVLMSVILVRSCQGGSRKERCPDGQVLRGQGLHRMVRDFRQGQHQH